MMEYRVRLSKDTNGTRLVTFPDLPGVHTFGADRADALARAADALATGVAYLIKVRQSVPAPTTGRGPRVAVPALLAAKIALHNLMIEQGVNRAELSRRMHVHRPQVDRLIDVRHGSTLEQLETAFDALGHRLDVVVTTSAG